MIINSKEDLNIYKPLILKTYKKVMGFDCNIDNPQRFTEKIQWLKIYDVILEKKYCSDKLNLRKYCKEKLDIDLCPKILKIYNKNEKMNINDIPDKCVFKCNHGSGWNIEKNLKNFNFEEAQLKLQEWCNINYAFYNNNCEFQYKDIIPQYFIEEFLDINCEYKFFCFNNVIQFCQVIWYDDKFEKGIWPVKSWSRHDAIVDTNFNMLEPYLFLVENRENEDEYLNENYKSFYIDNFKTMLEYSKKLSSDFKFVRVDFYNTKTNNIYLSEMTFTPSNGFTRFKHDSADYEIGKLLKL